MVTDWWNLIIGSAAHPGKGGRVGGSSAGGSSHDGDENIVFEDFARLRT